ncbi:metallophosphoesterase [Marinilactibacillus sp. Marseille-P9653]|uniref:metallophosphoesterase n=1 Tax=Marinilactibacillus sp. Marseille-P9653 TaxID=2866583 RepID=UPI001CE4B517|nr:metallophosphoesterase [Marinilactibacillus sp. Marseille-P9653]
MFTDRRLTEAYQNAKQMYFDDHSRIVFMSDAHRGDGSVSDEFLRSQNLFTHALNEYYESEYTFVEVGDGEELLEYSKFEHIKNAYVGVYETIKKYYDDDRYIRIYGNHDLFLRNKKYVEKNFYVNYDEYTEEYFDFMKGLEPIEALVLKHRQTSQEIFVLHGHQGDAPNDQFWFFTMLSLKYFWRFLHRFGIRNPASPIKNVNKRHKIERNYSKWIQKNRKMLICGHTHRFKFPKNNDRPYFNTGCGIYPASITAIELSEGMVRLVRWKEKVNEEGQLYIERETMRGPEPVELFDIRKPKEVVEYLAKLKLQRTKKEREDRASFREKHM